jgi:Protein of unknown function (DUF3037)
MAEKRHLDFFLVRYVSDAVRQISVPIGVVMHEPGVEGGFAEVRFTRDWRTVRCVDPQADVEILSALEADIRRQLVSPVERANLLKRFEDSLSNMIQISPARGCLAEDPVREIEAMASLYLEGPRSGGSARERSGRQKILAGMRSAWEQAGIAKFVLPVPVAPYTKPGDPFQFDFGYRVGGEIKLFQAVSLKANVDAGMILAGRYPKIAPVISSKTDAALALTAVVDDDLNRGQDAVQFALNLMEEERIRIAAAAEMPMIAEVARRELRA